MDNNTNTAAAALALWVAALIVAHDDGAHGNDISGYWAEAGCRRCAEYQHLRGVWAAANAAYRAKIDAEAEAEAERFEQRLKRDAAKRDPYNFGSKKF